LHQLALNQIHEAIQHPLQHSWQQHLPHWATVDHAHNVAAPGQHPPSVTAFAHH
jgi:hypothetical protein